MTVAASLTALFSTVITEDFEKLVINDTKTVRLIYNGSDKEVTNWRRIDSNTVLN